MFHGDGFDGALLIALAILWIPCAVFAHLNYKNSKKSLAKNHHLRGAWLVGNLWWVAFVVIFFAPFLIGLLAFAFKLGR